MQPPREPARFAAKSGRTATAHRSAGEDHRRQGARRAKYVPTGELLAEPNLLHYACALTARAPVCPSILVITQSSDMQMLGNVVGVAEMPRVGARQSQTLILSTTVAGG